MATRRLGSRRPKCQHSHMLLLKASLPRQRERGFTLVELLITVAIVAVLASLAYPSFMGAIRKSRRAEAVDMVTRIQQAEEKWRAHQPAYTTDFVAAGDGGLSATSSYYQFSVNVPPGAAAGSTYTITATAIGSQVADTQCTTMTAQMQAGRVSYAPPICWAQ